MQYLFLLGRNFEFSRAELVNFCDEVHSDSEKALFIGENLKFENPRELPKSKEQIFLDRLGGTIRFGKVLGEFTSKKELIDQVLNIVKETAKEGVVPKVGLSVFGGGKLLLGDFMGIIKEDFEASGTKIRIENHAGKNMTSGQIFDRRLLQKGNEFVIWKNGNSFLLAQTVANQNLRNYTLRDRKKSFRDAKMGMLPPKLAQILINLANPEIKDLVIDPFCGSGTVNTEAAVMGFQTEGSDINANFIKGAQQNFIEMSEKFRYPVGNGRFFVEDATQINWENKSGIICTEGFLGHNFTKSPEIKEIDAQARMILKIWLKVFKKLEKSGIKTVSLCLPCWNFKGRKISIAKQLFEKVESFGYKVTTPFNGKKTFIYERDKTFVARELCVLKKS